MLRCQDCDPIVLFQRELLVQWGAGLRESLRVAEGSVEKGVLELRRCLQECQTLEMEVQRLFTLHGFSLRAGLIFPCCVPVPRLVKRKLTQRKQRWQWQLAPAKELHGVLRD